MNNNKIINGFKRFMRAALAQRPTATQTTPGEKKTFLIHDSFAPIFFDLCFLCLWLCVVGALVWPQVEESCGWHAMVTSRVGAGTLLCAYVRVCVHAFLF